MNETKEEKFVGIDVSKKSLDICIQPVGQAWQVVYDEAGIGQVVECLKETNPALIVIEATGGMEMRVVTALASCGLLVAVINPRQARDFAKATGQLAKTDRVDAAVLAAFAKAIRPQTRPLKDADTRALNDLASRRRQLIDTSKRFLSSASVSEWGMRVQETLLLAKMSRIGDIESPRDYCIDGCSAVGQ